MFLVLLNRAVVVQNHVQSLCVCQALTSITCAFEEVNQNALSCRVLGEGVFKLWGVSLMGQHWFQGQGAARSELSVVRTRLKICTLRMCPEALK